MDEFSVLLKVFLAQSGVREVELRSGTSPLRESTLQSVLPYIAYLVDVGAKVLLGPSPIHVEVEADLFNLQVDLCPGTEIEIESQAAVLIVFSWLIPEPSEIYSFIPFENEITEIVRSGMKTMSSEHAANEYLVESYKSILNKIQLQRNLSPLLINELEPEVQL
jgi:hypothetical protein